MVGPHATDSRLTIELTDPDSGRLVHLPALDGLRGLAVAGVVAFHAGFERMVGGYLGVSTFFTLSGFLITSLLVAEARRTRSVSLRRFWTRRFRRLLPAALVTLLGVVVLFGPLVATPDQRATMPADVIASVADVANWRFILSGSSYGDLFVAPSPVLHFWSLSIEEQFYVVFPVALLGVWLAAKGRRRTVGLAIAALFAFTVLEPWIFDMSVDRVYFGTDTRAPELLAGALVALALTNRQWRLRLVRRPRWRRTAALCGGIALAVQLWAWWALPQSTEWLYRGGLAAYAVLTCAVLVAATLPRGPLVSALSSVPLRWLGARSYGIYLIHWPIFLTFRQLWPDLSRPASTALAVSVTLVLAELSLRFIESPVRLGRWPKPGHVLRTAVAGMAVVAIAALLPLPGDDGPRTTDFDQAASEFRELGRRDPPSTTAPPSEEGVAAATTIPPSPPVVGIFGDSTALAVGMGYSAWLEESGTRTRVVGDAELGCGISRFDRRRDDSVVERSQLCASWPQRWGKVIDGERPDVVVLDSSVWEIADAQLPGQREWKAIGDPEVDEFVKRELLEAVDLLGRDGALVLVMTWPEYGSWADDGRPDAVSRQTQPKRMRRMHEILAEVVEARPGKAQLLDFAEWFGDRAQDRRWRADGTHFLAEDFADIARDWFGPEIDARWRGWAAGRAAEGSDGRS